MKSNTKFKKIYRVSDLNYNDIKPQKLMTQSPKKSIQKIIRFHELTRGLSPKRKSTKLLLHEVNLRKARKSTMFQKVINKAVVNNNNILKEFPKFSRIMETSQRNEEIEESRMSVDKNIEKNKLIKFRKILINSKNTRNNSIFDYGLHFTKAIKNKDDINFSSVSHIANLNEMTIKKEEKNETIHLEYSKALKLIQMPIINDLGKIDDFKEAFARIHVIIIKNTN